MHGGTRNRGGRTGRTGLTRRPSGSREKILDERALDNDTSGTDLPRPGKELPAAALYVPERAICAERASLPCLPYWAVAVKTLPYFRPRPARTASASSPVTGSAPVRGGTRLVVKPKPSR